MSSSALQCKNRHFWTRRVCLDMTEEIQPVCTAMRKRTDSVHRKRQDTFEFSVNSNSKSDLTDIFTEYSGDLSGIKKSKVTVRTFRNFVALKCGGTRQQAGFNHIATRFVFKGESIAEQTAAHRKCGKTKRGQGLPSPSVGLASVGDSEYDLTII